MLGVFIKRHPFRHTQNQESFETTMNKEKMKIVENPSGPTKTLRLF